MSDEESFVILGSSPMSSMENGDLESESRPSSVSPFESDASERFTSLKSSQIIELKSAQEIATQTPNNQKNSEIAVSEKELSKLWTTQPQMQEQEFEYCLEDCALRAAEHQNANMSVSLKEENSYKSGLSIPTSQTILKSNDNNLATSFLMGKINSDVLKTSVYSQFPSISMEASPEDVFKLQNMVTEYTQLKVTIKKANNTMKQFYNNSLQWKQKIKTIEEQYNQQLDNCKEEIEKLRNQNKLLENNFMTQIDALELARRKDREENIQEISEKNALLENMRAQILKLEKQQFASFEFVGQNMTNQQNDKFNAVLLTHQENNLKIRELQAQLSEMLASNLDLKDLEKQYIDELNSLKVSLTAAEELIKQNRAEISQLTSLNMEKHQKMETLVTSLKSLELAHEEQKEQILLLEKQNELRRIDFEIEKRSRETAVKEKQRLIQDLRSLQQRNKELIEDHKKIVENYQKGLSVVSTDDAQIEGTLVATQAYDNNPQRPIRVLPSTSDAKPTSKMHVCPVCNKAFKTLNVLLSHVNDCLDINCQ